jgi:hypothetical protein
MGGGQGEVSRYGIDLVAVEVVSSQIGPKLSGSLFWVSKGVNGGL